MDVAAAAMEHFGSAQLGDERRTQRLCKTAQRIMSHPDGTLPKKLPDWADLNGLYRLARMPQVTQAAVTEPHRQRTLQRMSTVDPPQTVLLIHDATELDYTHIHELADQLGQIGSGRGRGYICHNSLAVTEQGRVLGLAAQSLHRRRVVSKSETPRQKREHPQRESLLWMRGCQQSVPPQDCTCRCVDIADRGSDGYEFLEYAQIHGRNYVIRSARDRRLFGDDHVGDDRIHHKLHEYARDLPHLGVRQLRVEAKAGKKGKARVAQVRVAGGAVVLQQPDFARGICTLESISTWVIHVKEIDPPAGVDDVEWILLSNLPSGTFEQACERIDWYSRRPIIEDYHKGMKSGLGIELLQLEKIDSLEPVIGLLSVIAAVLLELRHAARAADADTMLACQVVPLIYVQVLSAHLHKQRRDDLSVREFLLGVAKLGGHLGRKHDGPPGWLTLWRGWSDLNHMVHGALAMREVRCV